MRTKSDPSSALICASPALAQAAPPPAESHSSRRELTDPATADRLAESVQACRRRCSICRSASVQAALEGRKATPAEKKLTVRDLARRDDPDFDRDFAADRRSEADDRAEHAGDERRASGDHEEPRRGAEVARRAAANMPDPNYPEALDAPRALALKLPRHVAALPVPALPVFPQGPAGPRREGHRPRAGAREPVGEARRVHRPQSGGRDAGDGRARPGRHADRIAADRRIFRRDGRPDADDPRQCRAPRRDPAHDRMVRHQALPRGGRAADERADEEAPGQPRKPRHAGAARGDADRDPSISIISIICSTTAAGSRGRA